MKAGAKTTEFWMSTVSQIVIAGMALMIGYGVVTNEQADLWTSLILATSPVAIAIIAANYSSSRAKVKANE